MRRGAPESKTPAPGISGAGVFERIVEKPYFTFTNTTANVNRASVSINTRPRIIAV
jgi:hypothetical protein